jgi:large subunit ribosomal protein L7/L12
LRLFQKLKQLNLFTTFFIGIISMAITNADILEAIGSMSVMELTTLIKEVEEKFGVSAAAVAVAAGPAAAGGAAAAEQTEFNVILLTAGEQKVSAI